MPRLIFANQLRAFAALSVVGSHLVGVYWGVRDFVGLATASPVQGGDPPAGLYHLFHLLYLHFGPLGVGVFFLVSGLVIPISLSQHSRATFLIARLLRIYPTYVAAIAIEMATVHASSAFWGNPFPYDDWTIVSNALLIHDLVGRPTVDLVNWTLCVELRFYLLMAMLAGPVRRGSLAALFGVAVAALAGNALVRLPEVAGAIGRPDLIESLGPQAVFIVFMLIGVLFNYRARGLVTASAFLRAAAAMALLFVACWWESPLRAQFHYVLCNYGYALALFGAAFALRERFRPVRVIDALAAVSFPIYLLHAIVGYSLLKALMLGLGWGYLPALAASCCAVLALAAALHAAIEKPTIRMGRALSARRGVGEAVWIMAGR